MVVYVAYGYHVDGVVMTISKESKKAELYSQRQSALELYDKERFATKLLKKQKNGVCATGL